MLRYIALSANVVSMNAAAQAVTVEIVYTNLYHLLPLAAVAKEPCTCVNVHVPAACVYVAALDASAKPHVTAQDVPDVRAQFVNVSDQKVVQRTAKPSVVISRFISSLLTAVQSIELVLRTLLQDVVAPE